MTLQVTVLSFTIDPEFLISAAGRVCYGSKGTNTEKFIKARIREGHDSILEHATITFVLRGISRACSHQLVRHRIASYSQESQRYVDMGSPSFVVPPSIQDNENEYALKLWTAALDYVTDVYNKLREMGVLKEDARYLLPSATETKIVVTMNFRSLRNFFKVRCDKAAQWEIRAVAKEMLTLSYLLAPSVFEDLYKEFME